MLLCRWCHSLLSLQPVAVVSVLPGLQGYSPVLFWYMAIECTRLGVERLTFGKMVKLDRESIVKAGVMLLVCAWS